MAQIPAMCYVKSTRRPVCDTRDSVHRGWIRHDDAELTPGFPQGKCNCGWSWDSGDSRALPALAQSEVLVPFTDLPETFPPPRADTRLYDIRTIDGPLTPPDRFFTVQHYGHPEVDPATFRLRVSGLVDRPLSLSLDDLRGMGGTDLVAGFECSGNRRPLQGLWATGAGRACRCATVLDRAGVKADAREFVFFGADQGPEDVEFRTQKFTVVQQFGRSLPREPGALPSRCSSMR
jgi:hypothetical protein